MKNEKKESSMLRFLYRTVLGRILLKLLTARWISKVAGRFLDSGLSKPLIKRFVKKNSIDLSDFHSDSFRSFNDCFTRKIKDGKREMELSDSSLISPCDGLLTVYDITDETLVSVKGSQYSIYDLVKNEELAKRYTSGICLVFRLCVNHYHRYIYIDDCRKGKNTFISGKLHTVRPIALEATPVFKQNCREYTVMETENFGTVTQIEVGAMLVGKIKNLHSEGEYKRGEEKGMFLYGGSTIVVLVENGQASIKNEILYTVQNGEEYSVRMGEEIGKKLNKKPSE